MLRKFQHPVASGFAATPSPEVPTPEKSAPSASAQKTVQRRQKLSIPMTGGPTEMPAVKRRPDSVRWSRRPDGTLQCIRQPGFLAGGPSAGFVVEGSTEEAEIRAALEADR